MSWVLLLLKKNKHKKEERAVTLVKIGFIGLELMSMPALCRVLSNIFLTGVGCRNVLVIQLFCKQDDGTSLYIAIKNINNRIINWIVS